MWWRALGVAVVLLCAGVAGGYAVADRTDRGAGPQHRARAGPGASRRRCPRPPVQHVLPDPEADPLAARPAQPAAATLRLHPARRRGHGRTIPDGWRQNRLAGQRHLELRQAEATRPTPTRLRIQLVVGADGSRSRWPRPRRIAALEQADADGRHRTDFDGHRRDRRHLRGDLHRRDGYLRVTMEQWVAFDGGHGVRRRRRHRPRPWTSEGLRDLLSRTVGSMQSLDAEAAEQRGADRRLTVRCRGSRRRRGPGWRWPGRRCGPGPTAACSR